MNKLALFSIVLFVELLLASIPVSADVAAPPGGLDVNIINPLPIPVDGNVTATIPETLNVNVANTPNVYNKNVKTPVSLYLHVGSTGDIKTIFEGNMAASNSTTPYIVPNGKQLVIEYISMETITFDTEVLYNDYTYWGMIHDIDSQTKHFAGSVSASENTFGVLGPRSGERVKIRISEGKNVTFGLVADYRVTVDVYLSGYLEDM